MEAPELSAACELHARYMGLNPDYLYQPGGPHTEVPGRPGYAPEGAAAAGNSILGAGSADPYWWPPYHRASLITPVLGRVGIGGEGQRIGGPGANARLPDSPRVFTFPGNGATDVPSRDGGCFEWPTNPGDDIFGKGHCRHGTALFVFPVGPYQDIGGSSGSTLDITTCR